MEEFVTGVIRKGCSVFEDDSKEEMMCYGCSTKFSLLLKRKRQCTVCKRYYCKECLPLQIGNSKNFNAVLAQFTDKKFTCSRCQILTARPLNRSHLLQLHSRDLKHYLTSQNISTRGCLEKDELVNLLMAHVAHTSGQQSSNSTTRDWNPAGQPSGSSVYNTESSPLHQNSSNSSFARTSNNTSHSSPRSQNVSDRPHDEYVVSSPSSNSDDSFVFISDNDVDSHAVPVEVSSLLHIEEVSECSEEGHTSPVVDLETDTEESRTEEQQTEESRTEEQQIEDHNIHTGFSADSEIDAQNSSVVNLDAIQNAEELETLTVKQLKELLYLNRVDFRGCCEKAELVERAARLWNEASLAKKELESLSMNELCKICMDAPVECVMLECGHMATCTTCGKQLSECPICRQYVVRIVRTFKA